MSLDQPASQPASYYYFHLSILYLKESSFRCWLFVVLSDLFLLDLLPVSGFGRGGVG